MKIKKFMKTRKIVVTVCCIAAFIGGACIYSAIQPETVQAKEGTEKYSGSEMKAGDKTVMQEKETAEETCTVVKKLEQEQKVEQRTKAAMSSNQESITASSGSQSHSSLSNSSGSGQGKQGETKESSQPTHKHIWKPIEEVQDVQEKKAIYGDKCNTCNKDITGHVEEHILGSSCMGYSTDVFIRYEYETVKTSVVIGYECSCGARR